MYKKNVPQIVSKKHEPELCGTILVILAND
jgi:hypothetical protein